MKQSFNFKAPDILKLSRLRRYGTACVVKHYLHQSGEMLSIPIPLHYNNAVNFLDKKVLCIKVDTV